MLLRFVVSNYRSIMDPVELSMIAVDEDRPAARGFDLLTEQVLTTAGIYGPNASGKSNVVEALAWLSMAVGQSLREWGEFIPREPFRFGPWPAKPSTHHVEMVVGGVRYEYLLEVDDSEVLFEGLYSYPERRRRVLFEREGTEIRFRRGLGTLTGTRELLTPTTLALSAMVRLGGPDIQRFGRDLASIGILGLRRRAPWQRYLGSSAAELSPTVRLFDERDSGQPTLFDLAGPPDATRESALALLRFADLGIDDVRFVERDFSDVLSSASLTSPRARHKPRRQLQLMHRVEEQELPFDLAEESAGTRAWFDLIGPTLAALRTGRIMLFDEIDASLHPRLSARLIELFQDPETNPLGAQLIFTSHDTSLLSHLNRDEVWLTEKGDSGATSLTALAEFGGDKVRRSLNLEKAYLQGRFGAVPEPDQVMLRRVLGLTSSRA